MTLLVLYFEFMNKNLKQAKKKGFTLIEILVVIGIIAVLAAVVLIAINPARQFALARNSQRQSNVSAILNAIGQNIAENKGLFNCSTSLPSATSTIKSGGVGDIASCLVPTYVPALPLDPNSSPAAFYNSSTDYNTQYTVVQTPEGRVTVAAPHTELSSTTISITR